MAGAVVATPTTVRGWVAAILLAGCATESAQRAYTETLRQVQQETLDPQVADARIAALARVHRLGTAWFQVSVESPEPGRFVLEQGRPLAELNVVRADGGRVRVTCADVEVAGACREWVWPSLYGDAYEQARQRAATARDAQAEADRRVQLESDIEAELASERQERAFTPRWGLLAAGAAELGASSEGLMSGAWARVGARRFHGSFWSSGYAVQAGFALLPKGGQAVEVSLPVRLELDHFGDHRYDAHRSMVPTAAAYAFAMPTVVCSSPSGPGAGWRVGVGGTAVVVSRFGGPMFSELSYEMLYLPGGRLNGVRFSVGVGL